MDSTPYRRNMMLLLSRVSLAIVLAVVVQCVDGDQRIIYVSKLFSDDENFFTSGEGDISLTCCVYGNCSCNFLDHALANLTSNTLINITTDVMLSSLVKISNFENVSIIGHNNPTVNCMSAGGIHFTFCHSCIIQGIVWNGCGTKSDDTNAKPGLKFIYSSNIKIQNCSFHHSFGQAIVLSKVSGYLNITHCDFINNTHYRGHGAAIHCLLNNVENSSQLLLTISNCTFTYNRVAKSLVYITNRNSEHNNNVTIYHCKFYHNQAVSIYVVNQKIYLNGNNLFQNNTAGNGTGIYITDHSTVIFGESSNVTFIKNYADSSSIIIFFRRGGIIFLKDHSNVIFDQNSKIKFYNNHATNGIIHSEVSSNVTFKGTCEVTFSSNSARIHGAAIYSSDNSHVIFTGNAKVTFSNNLSKHIYYGGTIYANNGYISFNENSSTEFRNNNAYYGGAIFSDSATYISFNGNSSTKFISNIADNRGGAILFSYSYISFEGNSSTIFTDNRGGAITSVYNTTISFKGNSSTMFSSNSAEVGGAILSDSNSFIFFEGNSNTMFHNNIASYKGGAIWSDYGSLISFDESSFTVFSNNSAEDSGGAICFRYHSGVSFKGNSSTVFSGNSADDNGGAIYSYSNSYNISFEGNATTVFNENIADNGGGINSLDSNHVSFEDNSNTTFNGNTATYNGGAVYAYNTGVSFNEFSTVMFRNNIADYGGAVFAEIYSDVIFSNNSSALFMQNKATFDTTVYSNGNSKIVAKEESTIMFEDVSAKWCKNTCLQYSGQSDVVTIDSDGIVWCSNQEAFVCLSKNCYCRNLNFIKVNNVIKNNITDKVMKLSSVIRLQNPFSTLIIGHNNLTVLCVNGGRLILDVNYGNITIEGITWIGCGGYSGIVTPVMLIDPTIHPIVDGEYSYVNVKIQRCSFQHSIAPAIGCSTNIVYTYLNFDINHCNFINNNQYRGHGTAMHFSPRNAKYALNNLNFINNGLAESVLYIEDPVSGYVEQIHINNCNFHNNQGVPLYLSSNLILYISGEILFENNTAGNGAGIYISDRSTVIFSENSNTKFINNSVYHSGAAIFQNSHSSMIFKQGSLAQFNNNKATSGTIYSKASSNITFMATCKVTFSGNSATQYGAAIYSVDNSHVTFTGNSKVTFNNNVIPFTDIDQQLGGTVFSESYSTVSFEGNSTTVFSNNTANFGAAIFSFHNSIITFKDKSRIEFNSNIAQNCGTLTSSLFSSITFNDNTEVTFNANAVSHLASIYYESFAGAICTFNRTNIAFQDIL